MAQIALKIKDNGPQTVEIVKRLRGVCSGGIAEVTKALATGEPIFVRRLFDRQDEDFPIRLLELLEWLESQSIQYQAFQVLDHETYDPSKCSQYYTVNADRLRTKISTRDKSLEEQTRFGRLEDGVED
ncbi:MAG: hypothetical protein U0903_22880 [Planctomycetales bacterium]